MKSSSSATRNAAAGEAGLSTENLDMLTPSLPTLSRSLDLPVCLARFPPARLWLKDESLEDSANLPAPDIIAAEIVEDLQAALAQFAEIASDLKK